VLALIPASLLASLPSPGFSELELGPFRLRMYGLCIALGVIAAVWISSKRWEARGGNPDDISAIALWAVPAGVIGARMYHVATDWKTYRGHWIDAFKITNGGLGIPGGVALGVIVGLIYVKRKGLPARPLLDVVAPAIPVAQAIGRLGNWFNQELFGRPTGLPWGLKVDADKVPAGYSVTETFHPTFLYEALWNLALAGTLVLLDRRKKLRPGELFTLYVLGYALGRLWVEELRIDHASLLLGIRVNIWMSVLAAILAAAVFARNRLLTPEPVPVGGAGTAGPIADPVVVDESVTAEDVTEAAADEPVEEADDASPEAAVDPVDPAAVADPVDPADPAGRGGGGS
jgi:prolipoprotein diacylglyceryl transferase